MVGDEKGGRWEERRRRGNKCKNTGRRKEGKETIEEENGGMEQQLRD